MGGHSKSDLTQLLLLCYIMEENYFCMHTPLVVLHVSEYRILIFNILEMQVYKYSVNVIVNYSNL
jgi:hypothetical protein